MPRILFINSVCGKGSTGRICTDLYDLAVNDGYECCIAYGRGNHPKGYNTFKIGNKIDIYGHVLMTRLFDKHGFGSKFTTKKLLKFIDSYKPDIIHLHNIHGYYLNIKCLCDYLRNNSRIKVIWTLHDCWAFTGHCAYFTFSKCNKWKNDCRNCQYRSSYPSNLLYSNSKKNFDKKKHLFTSLPNLVLVTPSKWLKSIVDDSFLHKYECRVIHNGIDSSIFKNKGKNTENKVTTILGLANIWDERKGFKTFLELAETIKDEDYKIILVGLSKKQIKELPTNILGIERTNNVDELVELYNEADVFFNPTLEDNYPTVNLEAQACGLPVITFDSGGARETIYGSHCFVVESLEEFIEIIRSNDFRKYKCDIKKENYDKYLLFNEYINLYKEVKDESSCNRI